MKATVLPDDVLRHLEKRVAPVVRRPNPRNSDGIFSGSGIPMVAVEEALTALENPDLLLALFRLDCTPEQAMPFIDLLETFGAPLIQRILAAYLDGSVS